MRLDLGSLISQECTSVVEYFFLLLNVLEGLILAELHKVFLAYLYNDFLQILSIKVQ